MISSTTSVSLNSASQNVKLSSEALEKGMDQVANIGGPKGLIHDNAALRDDVTTLQTRLAGADPGLGVIVAKGNIVRFVILGHTGELLLNVWLDTASHWVLKDLRLKDRDVVVPADFSGANYKWFADIVSARGWVGIPGERKNALDALQTDLPDLNAADKQVAQTAFQSMLASSAITPPGMDPDAKINDDLLKTGDHTLHVTVVPVKPSPSGHWSIVGQLQVISPDGATTSNPKTFSTDDGIAKMNAPGGAWELSPPLTFRVQLATDTTS